VAYDHSIPEVVVIAARGEHAQWVRNLKAAPAILVVLLSESFDPRPHLVLLYLLSLSGSSRQSSDERRPRSLRADAYRRLAQADGSSVAIPA
jgi:hypothetical protein